MDLLSITRAARESPDQPALLADGRLWTLGDLAERAGSIRRRLNERELSPDARIAIRATNRFETVVTLLALVDEGRTFVPIHPRLTAAEANVLINDAEVSLALDDHELTDLAMEGPSASAPQAPDPNGILALLYTSGTTGRPKGALLPRSAFVASALASAQNLGWRDDDRWLLCMPVCHVGGLSILTRCLMARKCVVLHPRFDPEAVLRSIRDEGVTLLSVVPTMLATLLERDRGNVLSRLRAMLVGGAACPSALLEESARRSIPALATYGLTEACSQVTVQPLAGTRSGSGAPLPGTEVAIIDGRIHVRGPTLMRGYWRHPPLTDWFDTGDLGLVDEYGNLHVAARRSDLIVTGGENVYPAEVENVLLAHPEITGALVFGVPDDRWGQIVCAAVVAKSKPDLRTYVEDRLAAHKRPRRIAFVDELPTTSLGKPDRLGAFKVLSDKLE